MRVHRTARPATTHELEISDDLYERIESHLTEGEPHQEFVAELPNVYETKLPASGETPSERADDSLAFATLPADRTPPPPTCQVL